MSRNPPGLEDVDASEGIWYLVYFKPTWTLIYGYGLRVHVRFWNERVVKELMRHYRLKGTKTKHALESLHKSMPRGRVFEDDRGRFTIMHGDDCPPKKTRDTLDTVISVFGLTNRYVMGRVKVEYNDHETMSPEHKEGIQELIGKVPY